MIRAGRSGARGLVRAGLLAMAAALAPGAHAAEQLPVVTVTAARPAEIVVEVPVTGTLVAREEVMVNPQVAGQVITAIHADVGDRVRKGDLLVELDRDMLALKLDQARANAAGAQAAVRQAEAQVALAQANLEQARSTAERNRSLFATGAVPQSVLDQSETALKTAEANLAAAEQGLASVRTQIAQAEVQVRLAELDLAHTRIRAPVDGTVARREARLGAVAVAGAQPLFTLIADDEIEVSVEVIETDINRLHPGDPVRLQIAGVGPVEGQVRLVPPTVDERTRLGTVRIRLPGGVPGLRVGLFARGEVVADRHVGLTVPLGAVLSRDGRDHVLVVDDAGVVHRREITAGAVWGGRREVLAGLAEGERVLERAGVFFEEGDRVTPVPAAEAEGGAMALARDVPATEEAGR